jgi:ornithine carbamoyltransferase
VRHFIDLTNWQSRDLWHIIQLATHLKLEHQTGGNRPVLKGKALGIIFSKPSLRTRVSFEVAMQHLGGSSIALGPDEIGKLGERESIPDIARVMSRYVQVVAARVYSHWQIRELADHATIPIINALCDQAHPCQAMADMLTIFEHYGRIKGLRLAYVGDGNNVAASLLLAAAHFGMHFTIATPKEYELPARVLVAAAGFARSSGATIQTFNDPKVAVHDADVVYTDTWVSMGNETEAKERTEKLRPFQLNRELMAEAHKDSVVLHCLPAHRGDEITADVADGPQSLIFEQAENRLHAQKAILVKLLVLDR